MIRPYLLATLLITFLVVILNGQDVSKKTAFSVELTPSASIFTTYKNWTRNHQLGIGMKLRHHRPFKESSIFPRRAFLLNAGIYYHEYFVPNTHLGLGYEWRNNLNKSRWEYSLYGIFGVGRAQLIDEHFFVENNALKSGGAINRWHLQPAIGTTIGYAIGKKEGFQFIPKVGIENNVLIPYKAADGSVILKENTSLHFGLEFKFKTK